MEDIKPICTGCNKRPHELEEYMEWDECGYKSADDKCQQEEGTYNTENGHFLCTPCYIAAGMPANPYPSPGWVAP